MALLLGIDVGTTNTKALVYDVERREVIAVGRVPTRITYPGPDAAEFLPDDIWNGVTLAVREAMATVDQPERITAVAVASMGEAGIPIDEQGRCLYPAIAWYDPRTQPQRAWWAENVDPFAVYTITGHPLRHIYTLYKLMWLRLNAPDVYATMDKWLCIEDFILWKLSGEMATDYTIASRTSLFDQRVRHWSPWVAEQAGIDLSIFPEPHPSGTQIGVLSPTAAVETGLPEGIAVVTGGHDHLVGALAAGVVGPGTVLDSTGTAESILAPVKEFKPDIKLFQGAYSLYCHVVRDAYVVQGGLTASGKLVDWLVDLLWAADGKSGAAGRQELYARAFAEAAASPAGARGLAWSPLAASGSPTNDPLSRAAIMGLTITHQRGDMLRALLEALGFWLRESLEYLQTVFGPSVDGKITTIGGATYSPLWMQIKANTTGREIRACQISESVALGAALLAGLGSGVWQDADEVARSLPAADVYHPDAASAKYRELFESVHIKLYPSLVDINHSLGK